jgi:hypothetical protein
VKNGWALSSHKKKFHPGCGTRKKTADSTGPTLLKDWRGRGKNDEDDDDTMAGRQVEGQACRGDTSDSHRSNDDDSSEPADGADKREQSTSATSTASRGQHVEATQVKDQAAEDVRFGSFTATATTTAATTTTKKNSKAEVPLVKNEAAKRATATEPSRAKPAATQSSTAAAVSIIPAADSSHRAVGDREGLPGRLAAMLEQVGCVCVVVV